MERGDVKKAGEHRMTWLCDLDLAFKINVQDSKKKKRQHLRWDKPVDFGYMYCWVSGLMFFKRFKSIKAASSNSAQAEKYTYLQESSSAPVGEFYENTLPD